MYSLLFKGDGIYRDNIEYAFELFYGICILKKSIENMLLIELHELHLHILYIIDSRRNYTFQTEFRIANKKKKQSFKVIATI